MRAAHSPDSVHWTPYEEAPNFGKSGPHLSDVMIATCDPTSRTYLLMTRHDWMGLAPRAGAALPARMPGSPTFDRMLGVHSRRNRRRIFLSESRDFLHWTEPRLILAPEPGLDNLDDAFYGMTPLCLGDQWIGFLNVFHVVSNTMNVQLVYRRDRRGWHRLAPTRPWLDCGQPGSWDRFMVNAPSAPVPVDDEPWVYSGGAKNHHDWWFAGLTENRDRPELWDRAPEVQDWEAVGYHLGLARLRLEGFVSLHAHRVREGLLATQPLASPGDRLVINAACGRDGYIKVELADEAGNALPGRDQDRCDPFTGDAVRHPVTWGGDPTASMPEGAARGRRPAFRRLRFVMRNAHRYAFRLVRRDRA